MRVSVEEHRRRAAELAADVKYAIALVARERCLMRCLFRREARANGATRLCTGTEQNCARLSQRLTRTARPSKTSISTRVTGRFKRSCDGQIDVTNLDRVVELDTVKGTVVVQPYVSMGVISDIILPLGWQLPVMPEMEDLTIGNVESARMVIGMTPVRRIVSRVRH
jgi:hypothetical protein